MQISHEIPIDKYIYQSVEDRIAERCKKINGEGFSLGTTKGNLISYNIFGEDQKTMETGTVVLRIG